MSLRPQHCASADWHGHNTGAHAHPRPAQSDGNVVIASSLEHIFKCSNNTLLKLWNWDELGRVHKQQIFAKACRNPGFDRGRFYTRSWRRCVELRKFKKVLFWDCMPREALKELLISLDGPIPRFCNKLCFFSWVSCATLASHSVFDSKAGRLPLLCRQAFHCIHSLDLWCTLSLYAAFFPKVVDRTWGEQGYAFINEIGYFVTPAPAMLEQYFAARNSNVAIPRLGQGIRLSALVWTSSVLRQCLRETFVCQEAECPGLCWLTSPEKKTCGLWASLLHVTFERLSQKCRCCQADWFRNCPQIERQEMENWRMSIT